jgi:hypothetical protein
LAAVSHRSSEEIASCNQERIHTVKTATWLRSSGELGPIDLPVPGQQLFELSNIVIVDAGEDVGEPCLRVDVVEPCGLDQCVHHGGTLAAAVGTGEEPRLAAQRNLAAILPISGRMSSSIIAGTHCTAGACVVFRASDAHQVMSCTWSYRPAR